MTDALSVWRVMVDDPDMACAHAYFVIAGNNEAAEYIAAMRAIVDDDRGPGVNLPQNCTPAESAKWRWFYASDEAVVRTVASYATSENLGPVQ